MKIIYLAHSEHAIIDMSTMNEATDIHQTNCAKMKSGISHFMFVKKDGSIREAFGTLVPALIENMAGPKAATDGRATAANPTSQSYFDIGAGDWRAYVIENLLAVL